MSDRTEPSWGAGSSAYARLRRLNDDEEAGAGFFDRSDDLPPAGEPEPNPPRKRRAAERKSEPERQPERGRKSERKPERQPERESKPPRAGRRTDRAPEPDRSTEDRRAERTQRTERVPEPVPERFPERAPERTRRSDRGDRTARTERVMDPFDDFPTAPAAPTRPPAAPAGPPMAQAEPATGESVDEASGRNRRRRSAGRNVPVSIVVGLLLAGTVLGVLFYEKPWFILVLIVASLVGIWELVRAIRNSGANPPIVPLMVGGTVMLGLAWFRGVEALSLGMLVTVLAVFVWRLADGPAGYQRDMGAAALITIYVPFLLGFAAPLATPDDGPWRILTTLAVVILSDTGGFVAGVLFGKHPMAPVISPKKSWEGFAGSVAASAIGGAVLMWQLIDVAPWWGAVFGAVVAVAAVLGDLAESLLKRDLGVKDMSNLLPGHGGLMDRLDSILFALPTAYLLFQLLAPPA
jgi:phosphatidate cytidylyltransferase